MVSPDRQPLVIAVLGLGEAGSLIARDLAAAGTRVRGYDPAVTAAEPVLDTVSETDAAREAGLVLSVNSAKAAVEAFKAGLPGLLTGGRPRPGVLWADLNTASPGAKRQLARLAEDAGVPFADVAMMAPVPGRGLRVPMLASGPGAVRYAALLGSLGAAIEVLDGPAGLAASKKLLRSVFYKGMAASIVEALDAARAAGEEQWLREHIAAELAAADAATMDRITDGSRRHAVRRAAEMEAAADMLVELGVPPLMADASRALHERLARGELRPAPDRPGPPRTAPDRPGPPGLRPARLTRAERAPRPVAGANRA
jgi:3-hydroxyisobutyrate dehydrogenase-like beta-hydroxyacid dehydrogenase